VRVDVENGFLRWRLYGRQAQGLKRLDERVGGAVDSECAGRVDKDKFLLSNHWKLFHAT
jgi:hypothetical protein